jgi:tetratricopeptide (TPR) repeat protein
MIRNKHGKNLASYEQLEEIYRPLLAFSAHELYKATARLTNDPVRYEQLMVRYAEKNAAGFFTLGRFFAYRNDESRAVTYYEKGMKAVGDAVSMANNSEWLVFYYLRNGRTNEAEALADRAAQVYSSIGLGTKAGLLETQAKYSEAFDYYRKIEERYDNPSQLVGFCVRYKAITGDTRYDDVVKKHLLTLFPRGLEKVELKDFTQPPVEGVLLPTDNDLLKKAGLKRGDIIVAVDGLRVYAIPQYQYVRDLTNAPVLTIIAWNGAEYTELNANPPKRRFGSPLENFYKPSSPPE